MKDNKDLPTRKKKTFICKNNSKGQKELQVDSSYCQKVTGSLSKDFSERLMMQTIGAVYSFDDELRDNNSYVACLDAMKVINPKDEVEGMLASQMVTVHNAAMECFRRAMISSQNFDSIQMCLNQANKLTRSYTSLMDALNRYRGKNVSEQKMTVEHVHVHDGGQAIVGNVNGGNGEG